MSTVTLLVAPVTNLIVTEVQIKSNVLNSGTIFVSKICSFCWERCNIFLPTAQGIFGELFGVNKPFSSFLLPVFYLKLPPHNKFTKRCSNAAIYYSFILNFFFITFSFGMFFFPNRKTMA